MSGIYCIDAVFKADGKFGRKKYLAYAAYRDYLLRDVKIWLSLIWENY